MRRHILHLMAAIGCTLAFFAMMGIVGDYDYTEQVILRMSYEDYDYAKDTLTKQNGKKPSEREIAHWWVEHHEGSRCGE